MVLSVIQRQEKTEAEFLKSFAVEVRNFLQPICNGEETIQKPAPEIMKPDPILVEIKKLRHVEKALNVPSGEIIMSDEDDVSASLRPCRTLLPPLKAGFGRQSWRAARPYPVGLPLSICTRQWPYSRTKSDSDDRHPRPNHCSTLNTARAPTGTLAGPAAACHFRGMLWRTGPPGKLPSFIEAEHPDPSCKAPGGAAVDSRDQARRLPLIVRKRDDRVRLFTRRGREAVAAIAARSAVIDGEAVYCDGFGLAVFNQLLSRAHDDQVNNLLEFDGPRPLEERKAKLALLIGRRAVRHPETNSVTEPSENALFERGPAGA